MKAMNRSYGCRHANEESTRSRVGLHSPRSRFGLVCGLLACLAVGCSHTIPSIGSKTLSGRVGTDPADKTLAAKIWLEGTDADDTDMQTVGKCRSYRELYLSRTQVTDEGLKQLAGFSKLQILDVSNTAISDAGIQHLKNLPALSGFFCKIPRSAMPG